jgi:hypothetical protein
MTFGAMLRFKPENVWDPEQPLKSCPSVMVVTASPTMVKAMGLPCAVVPFHWPAWPSGVGAVLPLHAPTRAHRAITGRWAASVFIDHLETDGHEHASPIFPEEWRND